MLKAVLFDMDGTLGDTLPLCVEAYRQCTAEITGHTPSREEVVSFFGLSDRGVLAGLLGSLFFSMLMCGIFSFFCTVPPLWHFMVLGVICGVAGQVGDLFASLIKRHCNIKDFSNLFPGHGGMLDRLDSVLFMAIIIFCYRIFFLRFFFCSRHRFLRNHVSCRLA